MKRSFQIRDIKVYDNPYRGQINLHLDNNLTYSNGSANYINVANKSPFKELKVGDTIYIKEEDTVSHSSNSVFGENIISRSE